MQVVINRCFGGFGLSREAVDLYCAWTGKDPGAWNATWGYYTDFHDRELPRDDPILVTIVDYLGEDSGGKFSELAIVDIPDGIEWEIHDYDGSESIHEKHRFWR